MSVARLRPLLLALGAAVAFWLYAKLSLSYTVTLSVPVSAELAKQVALATPLPPKLQLYVHGSGWQLLGLLLWERPRQCVLPLQGVQPPALVRFSREQLLRLLQLPTTVAVFHMVPDTLSVRLESAVHRSVPVELRVRLRLPPGFVLSGPLAVEPQQVQLRGAAEAVAQLPQVATVDTQLEVRTARFQATIPLQLPHSLALSVSPAQVSLQGNVEQEAEAVIEDVPVALLRAPLHTPHQVLPPRVRLWVRGPLSRVQGLTPEAFHVTVHYEELLRDTLGQLLPQIRAPQGIAVFRVEPPTLLHIRNSP
jgi:hypothetical protein